MFLFQGSNSAFPLKKQYRSENGNMISSSIHLRKWDATPMKSIGKTRSYVREDGYQRAETKLEQGTTL